MPASEKDQTNSQGHGGKTEPLGREVGRPRRMGPIFVFIAVVIAAVVTWIVVGTHADGPPAAPPSFDVPSSDLNVSSANASASDSGDAGEAIAGGPKILFPETTFDFGTVIQGETVSHTFAVRNTGDAPLTLIRAKGS